MKNYYKILEIDPLASHEDIKHAYREMAKKYHPDVSKEENTEDIIREINEAYEVLSDENERRRYDLNLKYALEESLRREQPQIKHDKPQKQRSRHKIIFNTGFQSTHTIGQLIIAFLIVLLIGGIVFFVEWSYINRNNKKDLLLKPGITANEVIKIYGEPDEMSVSELRYGNGIVLVENNKVVGWYDAYGTFNIQNKDIESVTDIVIGENIENLFRDYGWPDTYGRKFVVYGHTVVYYDDAGSVLSVETMT